MIATLDGLLVGLEVVAPLAVRGGQSYPKVSLVKNAMEEAVNRTVQVPSSFGLSSTR